MRLRLSAVAAVMAVLVSGVPLLRAAEATTPSPLAWGSNDHGQLGPNGPQPFSANPVEVPGLGDVKQLAAGLSHSLAVRSDGTVWAWGRNAENELGDGHSAYTTNFGATTDPNRDPNKVPAPSPDN